MPLGTFTRKPLLRPRSSSGSGNGRLQRRKHIGITGSFPIGQRVRSGMRGPVRVLPVPLDRDALIQLCETYRISELALFGSVIRDDFNPRRSDVDVLVEFLPDTPVRGFGIYDGPGILTLQEDLEKVFRRKVDLVRKEGLDKYIKDDVLRRRMIVCKSSDDGSVLFMPPGREPEGSPQGGPSAVCAETVASESNGNGGAVLEPSTDLTPGDSRGTDAFVGLNKEAARKTRGVKKPDIYLLHIRDDCQRILRFTGELTPGDFAVNEEKQLVVAKLLEKIGENANKLSKGFRKKHSEVSWERWIESRHHLVHAYEDVLINTMWDTITEKIPKLLVSIEALIQEFVDTAPKKE